MKYTLKEPVKMGDASPITELTFRERAVSGDLRGIPMRDPMLFDDVLKIAGRLCAQPDYVMNNLGMDDTGEVISMTLGFLRGGQPTGSAS